MKARSVKAAFTALLILLAFGAGAAPAWAQDGDFVPGETVSVEDLINNMSEYDGREITIEGESIGDVMRRGEFAWITVNDDAYSRRSLEEGGSFAGYSNIGIGVWVRSADADDIKHLGTYKTKGDQVRVTGTFYRACPEHDGGTDIHAARLTVLESGYEMPHPFDYARLVLVLTLLAVCLGLWFLRRRKIKSALRID